MKSKKFLFINTHFIPDFHYGGVVESGSKLFKYLKRMADFRISCVSEKPEKVRKYISDEDHCYKSIYFHRFAVSFDAIFGLWQDIKNADVILINGIFTFPVTLAQFYAFIFKKPFIVATRGGLEPWRVKHKKWKKYFYIKFITLLLMKKAKYIHVTSLEEEKNIRNLGFGNIINISNGVDLEEFLNLPNKYSYFRKYEGKFIFLFLSRTDKEKGIAILIEAYRKFCILHDIDKHLLIIAGPDNQGYLKKLSIDFQKENIERIGGIYGEDKIKIIRRADVVILPSYSENFGNIIAESLACERPVITTTGTPWRNIGNIGCGYCINPDVDALFKAIEKIYLKSRKELDEMGKRGRDYIIKNFSWESKAKEIYEYLRKTLDEK